MFAGLRRRVATFFILLGIFILFVFFSSDMNREPQFSVLVWGLGITAVGMLLMRGSAEPPQDSARFSTVRKIRNREKKTKEKRGLFKRGNKGGGEGNGDGR